MSGVYTRFRTETEHIPIWPVYKDSLSVFILLSIHWVSCGFCKKGATRSQEQRQPQMESFRNTLGGRLEIEPQ